MAELLVRVKNKPQAEDVYLDVRRSKRGDVIVVSPDGWPWGKEELANPDWRIFRIIGMSESQAQSFLQGETFPPEEIAHIRMRRWRGVEFNMPMLTLPTRVRDFILDETRAQPILAISLALGESLLKLRTSLRDPAVIG